MIQSAIEMFPLERLTPRRGARIHPPNKVRQISEGIRRFGFLNPILIDDDDRILNGHALFAAAELLDMAEVPCVRVRHFVRRGGPYAVA